MSRPQTSGAPLRDLSKLPRASADGFYHAPPTARSLASSQSLRSLTSSSQSLRSLAFALAQALAAADGAQRLERAEPGQAFGRAAGPLEQRVRRGERL